MKRSIALLYGSALSVVASVALLNLLFEYFDPSIDTMVERSVDLAAEAQGVVSLPEDLLIPFKFALLQRARESVDGVVIGSSTLLGLRPPSIFGSGRWLNMAINSNFLFSSIGQASDDLQISRRLRHVVIALDWGIGMPFKVEAYSPVMLRKHPPLFALLRDILSTSRTEQTMAIIAMQAADHSGGLFAVGSRHQCHSGEPTISFTGSESCNGTRADGSSAFFDPDTHEGPLMPIAASNAADLLDKSHLPQSEYYKSIVQFKGLFPEENFNGLEKLASSLSDRGGSLALVMPPMLPGLARLVGEDAVSGPMLKSFKAQVDRWAAEHAVKVFDLNASEAFGCGVGDFADGHHALTSCWDKIDRFHGEPLRSGGPGDAAVKPKFGQSPMTR